MAGVKSRSGHSSAANGYSTAGLRGSEANPGSNAEAETETENTSSIRRTNISPGLSQMLPTSSTCSDAHRSKTRDLTVCT
ncbi:hypothetical protein HYALB_00010281 [Hymenoscyphus albidus]|uniref:Uncharacterized protein n=1 Tax=Hymenoscyphus albidus TaxID=595503 RepID=A0A9N9PXA5_9HELO|nr:hypothetical protein HYALB_00010281 [Hymenoscyphus albidus]